MTEIRKNHVLKTAQLNFELTPDNIINGSWSEHYYGQVGTFFRTEPPILAIPQGRCVV